MIHNISSFHQNVQSCVVKCFHLYSRGPWFGPHWILMIFKVGVSLGKTFQSHCLVLLKPRKDMNNASGCLYMTEVLLKVV